MARLGHRYLLLDTTALPAHDRVDRIAHSPKRAWTTRGPLRYSSPWPWINAVTISLGMWGGIGWVIWKMIQ
jgi:hypothetical protein